MTNKKDKSKKNINVEGDTEIVCAVCGKKISFTDPHVLVYKDHGKTLVGWVHIDCIDKLERGGRKQKEKHDEKDKETNKKKEERVVDIKDNRDIDKTVVSELTSLTKKLPKGRKTLWILKKLSH